MSRWFLNARLTARTNCVRCYWGRPSSVDFWDISSSRNPSQWSFLKTSPGMSDWAAWSVKAADIGWDFQWLRLARWPWFEKHKCRMPFCEWQFCSHFFTIPACDKFEVDREWILNASTSASIDTIYLKNILSFLLNSTVSAKLHTDNSANKQIACKLETSRLCRVSGRLLRMQGKNCSSWNNMESLRCWNKLLARERHFIVMEKELGKNSFLSRNTWSSVEDP